MKNWKTVVKAICFGAVGGLVIAAIAALARTLIWKETGTFTDNALSAAVLIIMACSMALMMFAFYSVFSKREKAKVEEAPAEEKEEETSAEADSAEEKLDAAKEAVEEAIEENTEEEKPAEETEAKE